ncbi:MAG: RMD1 family protein [Tissierellia bacterium]|nr:RMD1 family protein [Tissierellia bacterium]MDD4780291.1 RMD1 family protein [Tissierellia bacterium]
MDRIMFYTFKAAYKLPLIQIASFFNIKFEATWKEYIKLDESEIEKIFKYFAKKSVYLYKYGCITFVNFNQDEIHYFLDYLRKLYIEIDDKLISRYYESHTLLKDDEGFIKLWDDLSTKYNYSIGAIDIIASILAKSVELNKIEKELSQVLDEADMFIAYLKKGMYRANSKKVISTVAECNRFKYNTIESVKLLDRPLEFSKTIESREIYNKFSDYFELNERYNILSNRTNVLDSILEEYFDFISNESERRLLMFEILLLSLFSLMHILF